MARHQPSATTVACGFLILIACTTTCSHALPIFKPKPKLPGVPPKVPVVPPKLPLLPPPKKGYPVAASVVGAAATALALGRRALLQQPQPRPLVNLNVQSGYREQTSTQGPL